MHYYLLADYVSRLEAAGDELNTALAFYTEWGKNLGLAIYSCCLAAALLGFFLKSM